ncbi:MAG TPA: hypothetical protein VNZ03_01255 [Terriglobales bacterium]|jgi:hypothetical protein|nr:hypothetical protein [Terriglobales bacterium]
MNANFKKNLALLVSGALLGICCALVSNAAQEYRPRTGYSLWSKADANAKYAYLLGYADAEQSFRLVLDKAEKSLCTDSEKDWFEDFNRKIPIPNITFQQATEGIDDFYKDWRNQSVALFNAQNIVRLQIAGRPQAEIDEAIRRARETASKK